jgi:hypothetical protein
MDSKSPATMTRAGRLETTTRRRSTPGDTQESFYFSDFLAALFTARSLRAASGTAKIYQNVRQEARVILNFTARRWVESGCLTGIMVSRLLRRLIDGTA